MLKVDLPLSISDWSDGFLILSDSLTIISNVIYGALTDQCMYLSGPRVRASWKKWSQELGIYILFSVWRCSAICGCGENSSYSWTILFDIPYWISNNEDNIRLESIETTVENTVQQEDVLLNEMQCVLRLILWGCYYWYSGIKEKNLLELIFFCKIYYSCCWGCVLTRCKKFLNRYLPQVSSLHIAFWIGAICEDADFHGFVFCRRFDVLVIGSFSWGVFISTQTWWVCEFLIPL